MVVIDDDVFREACEDSDQLGLLVGLLSHPFIRLLRYSDSGPPEDAPRVDHERRGEIVPGWLTVGPYDERHLAWPVAVPGPAGSSVTGASITGNGVEVAESDERTSAYSTLEPSEAAARRRSDAIAVQGASAAHADLFITRRPFLHEVTWDLAGGVLVSSPEDALPLVSLYLRAQDVFVTYRSADGTATDQFDKLLFYWVGARELLPAGWRWFGACVQAGAEDDSMIFLAQSALRRVDRALRARDAVHWALNRPQNNETAAEVVANLDFAFLALVGALDVTARVAHRALGLSGREYSASWRQEGWLRDVRESAPELADLVRPGSAGRLTVDALALLRNSIHGAAMSPLAISTGSRTRTGTLVGLPADDTDRLLTAMDGLGGRESWGVQELLPHRAHAEPGDLIDRALVAGAELIDEIMRVTPVERLLPADASELRELPPEGDDVFSEWNRKSIRWQLGL